MNIKLIFLFTICVVLPNGLYSAKKKKIKTLVNRKGLVTHWMPQKNTESVFEVDDKGNVLIRVLITSGCKKNKIFVKKRRVVGVNLDIPNRFDEGLDNLAVIDYFSNILEVPHDALEIVTGLYSKKKVLKLKHGFLKMEDALEKVIDEHVESLKNE